VRRFGHFRLVDRLGQGRQGQVWKAIQLEPIIETVALKLLDPTLALDPKRLEQFHREAEVGAQLASPSLLPTYEFGEINGVVYMTMPLVNGDSLADVIAQTLRRSSGAVLPARHWWAWLSEEDYLRSMSRVIVRIARALEVAHANRVAHRDIKPANILLDRDREDRVYLCDFGLSRDLDAPPPESLAFGTGTPLYMPPEKLAGCAVDDVRGDIYALGVTLFEALARVHPFSVPAGLVSSRWAAHLALATPKRLRAINPRVGQELEAVVLRAMSRNPSDRYPSAAAFADDLERLTLSRARIA
jgi:serine/threonine-protein kinase